MTDDEISVDQHGKLDLARPDKAEVPIRLSDRAKRRVREQADPAAVRQAVVEQVEQQEAEQATIAQAREQATSAEPPESGAVTAELPLDD